MGSPLPPHPYTYSLNFTIKVTAITLWKQGNTMFHNTGALLITCVELAVLKRPVSPEELQRPGSPYTRRTFTVQSQKYSIIQSNCVCACLFTTNATQGFRVAHRYPQTSLWCVSCHPYVILCRSWGTQWAGGLWCEATGRVTSRLWTPVALLQPLAWRWTSVQCIMGFVVFVWFKSKRHFGRHLTCLTVNRWHTTYMKPGDAHYEPKWDLKLIFDVPGSS